MTVLPFVLALVAGILVVEVEVETFATEPVELLQIPRFLEFLRGSFAVNVELTFLVENVFLHEVLDLFFLAFLTLFFLFICRLHLDLEVQLFLIAQLHLFRQRLGGLGGYILALLLRHTFNRLFVFGLVGESFVLLFLRNAFRFVGSV